MEVVGVEIEARVSINAISIDQRMWIIRDLPGTLDINAIDIRSKNIAIVDHRIGYAVDTNSRLVLLHSRGGDGG